MTVPNQTNKPMAIGPNLNVLSNMPNAQFIQWKRQNPNEWNKIKFNPAYSELYNKK